jgi:HEAT repeat protein
MAPTFPDHALNELSKNLGVADRRVRQEALSCLASAGAIAINALPAIVRALKDKDETIRQEAARILGQFGETAKAAEPELLEALKDKDLCVRFAAARAMASIDPRNLETAAILASFLKADPIGEMPRIAAMLLGNMEIRTNDIIEALQRGASANDESLARASKEALRRLRYLPDGGSAMALR